MRKIVFVLFCIFACCTFALAESGIEFYGTSILLAPPYAKGAYLELLMSDADGKRLGSFHDRNYKEITGGVYAEEKSLSSPSGRTIVLPNPERGVYTLTVTADDAGIYWVNVGVNLEKKYLYRTFGGVLDKGGEQYVEVVFTGSPKKIAEIQKKVDLELIRRELKTGLQFDKIDGVFGKDLVRELLQAEKALARGARAEAKATLKSFVWKLKIQHEKAYLKDKSVVQEWFIDDLTRDHARVWDILNKKDYYFSNLDNIRPERKRDWFCDQIMKVLIDDTEQFLDGIRD